ncbi:chemotaxis protein [Bdellovibrio sp. ZAP7]|uniref:PAS domain-containing protein n=1 Tax=Bdellovibrio sp. ZAP7 TaxID=2231053 RepID=UPI00115AC4D4|nr:PAS domain-containing protein [Bdellovibrio sp. ZAP7]QDK45239.1 chemotaxis protein [Bdellovibrio sp. ZAP7]
MSKQEADFSYHELFFSKTNRKGIIQSGNTVFVRVSEYEREDLLNRPHNIIRHPDTPRAVFKLFWNYLDANKPIAAYVKNKSKTGRYYWVFAMAFPLEDGFLSIRLKPSSKYFPIVQALYQDLTAQETMGLPLDEGITLIEERLRTLGFADYSDFMCRALLEEMSSRDHLLQSAEITEIKSQFQIEALEKFIHDSTMNTQAARLTFSKAYQLFEQTAPLFKDCEEILETCHKVKFVTLNLMVAASRLKEEGKPLGAVAANLQELTSQIAISSGHFEDVFKNYSKSVFEMFVAVAISRFQIEMMNQLAEETSLACQKKEDFDAETERSFQLNCEPIRYLINKNIQSVGEISEKLNHISKSLLSSIQTLNKVTSGMGVLHVVGKIEMARVGAGESLSSRLSEMDTLNSLFKQTLGNLERECKLNIKTCEDLSDKEDEIKSRLLKMS